MRSWHLHQDRPHRPEIIELANIARGIDPDNVKMGMVPGIDKYITDNGVELSYWVPDGEKTAQMVNDLIKGISREKRRRDHCCGERQRSTRCCRRFGVDTPGIRFPGGLGRER